MTQRHRVLLIVIAIGLSTGGVRGQTSGLGGNQISRFGYDLFRLLLQQQGLSAVSSDFATAFQDPSQTILIVLGDTPRLHAISNRLTAFVNKGGSLLIATDRADSKIAQSFGVRFRPPVIVYPRHAYQGLSDCPIIENFSRRHRLFRGVHRLVGNRCGTLAVEDSRTVLAMLTIRNSLNVPIIAAQRTKTSRALFVADHSLFVNEMLLHGDNALFVDNCIGWLRQPTARTKVILVADGHPLSTTGGSDQLPAEVLDEIVQAALANLPPVAPRPSDPSIRAFMNHLVTSLEDKNAFNDTLAHRPRGTGSVIVRRVAVLTAAILITMLFVGKLLTGYERFHQPQSANRRLWQKVDTEPVPLGGDYSGWMRVMTRDVFQRYLPEAAMADARRTPRTHIDLPLIRRINVRRQTSGLWQIAFGQSTSKVGRREFQRWLIRLRSIERLLEERRLRLD
jgi:hypothetical protein